MTIRGAALLAVLALATLGEGGAQPDAMMVWHLALAALVAVELLVPAPPERRTGLPWSIALCGALVAALLIVGAALAPAGYAAWLTLLEAAAVAGVALLAASRGPGFLAAAAPWLLALAAAQGGMAVWQRLIVGADRPAATFLNTNHLAAWLVAALLLAAGGLGAARNLPTASRRGRAAVLGLLALPALGGVLATGSRGAVLGLGVGAAVLAAMRWRRVSVAVRRALVAAVALAVVLAAGVIAVRLSDDDPFRWQRVRIWRATVDVFLDHPWSGTGPNQFAVAARPYQFADDDGPLRHDRVFTTTHSDVLRVASEFGVPGLVGFALLAAALARATVRRAREDPSASGAAAALAALVTQATVDNLSDRPAVYLVAALVAGAATAVPAAQARRSGIAVRGALLAVLTLVVAVGDVAPWLSWRELSRLPRGRLDAPGIRRLERAATLNPWHPLVPSRLAEHHAGAVPLTLESYVAAREAAERARRLSPAASEFALAVARVEAAGCLEVFGDLATRERARAAYAAAERLQPTNPLVPLELAAFLVRSGDPAGALEAAGRAVELEPDGVSPRVGLAEAQVAAGRPVAARESLDRALRLAEASRALAGRSPYDEQLLGLDAAAVAFLTARIDESVLPGRPEGAP